MTIETVSYIPYTRPLTTNLLRSLGPAYFQDVTFPGMLGVQRVFNVKDYGALGDASNDDTSAIQQAIIDAEAVYGGIVGLPPGTYKITAALRQRKNLGIIGMCSSVGGADSDYSTDAGTPNVLTQGVAIWQSTNNQNGLLIQQTTAGVYKIFSRIENILFIGQLDISGTGPGGTSGDGIVVSPGDVGAGVTCLWKNVSVAYFRGTGINLVNGYYGSTFDTISASGCGLNGWLAAGSSQGEFTVKNLRCFGNGVSGTTEAEKTGLYHNSGGSGITYERVSCTSNKQVQAYFKGSNIILTDYQAESFTTHNASSRSIVFENCAPIVNGCAFSPQSTFLGKVIDLRNVDNGIFNGLNFYTSMDATGYQIYEDASCSNNMYNYTTVTGTLQKNFNTNNSFIGTGSELYKKGTTTNDAAPAGFIGEEIRSAVAGAGAVSSTGNGQWFDITNITLTAGDWDINALGEATANGATVTYMDVGVSSTSGNSGTGLVNGDNQAEGPPPVAAYNATQFISQWRVSISASTTYYLKCNMGYAVATPKAFGRISARRIR